VPQTDLVSEQKNKLRLNVVNPKAGMSLIPDPHILLWNAASPPFINKCLAVE
jgi:hypothetical protein